MRSAQKILQKSTIAVRAGSEDISWTKWRDGLQARLSLTQCAAVRLLEGDK